MYSAVKIDGKRLYELARKGKTVEREPRAIVVSEFAVSREPEGQDVNFRVVCSKGTYIRSLAHGLVQSCPKVCQSGNLSRKI